MNKTKQTFLSDKIGKPAVMKGFVDSDKTNAIAMSVRTIKQPKIQELTEEQIKLKKERVEQCKIQSAAWDKREKYRVQDNKLKFPSAEKAEKKQSKIEE